jgi:hypothetical protein
MAFLWKKTSYNRPIGKSVLDFKEHVVSFYSSVTSSIFGCMNVMKNKNLLSQKCIEKLIKPLSLLYKISRTDERISRSKRHFECFWLYECDEKQELIQPKMYREAIL